MMRSLVGIALLAAPVVAGCGGGRECGKGTVRDGSTCRPFDPDDKTAPSVAVDPPARTRVVGNVTLTSNEPAIIYYTTDGTTPTTSSASEPNQVLLPAMPDDALVTYFAVDLAGNASDVTAMSWAIDRTGPRVRRLDLSLSDDERTLEWEAPANEDLSGLLIARVDGRLGAGPAPEATYAAGDEIAPGLTVVYASAVDAASIGTFVETQPVQGGIVRYAAWASDDLGNYGPAQSAFEVQPFLAQTGTLEIDVATGVVDVVHPNNFGVVGSSTLVGTTLTVHLALENRMSRVVFAPKIVLANILGTVGTWNDEDGSIDNNQYRTYGAAIGPGATLVRQLTIANVGPTDVITAGFSIDSGRVLGTSFWQNDRAAGITDEAIQNTVATLGPPPLARGPGGNMAFRGGGITPDGYYIMGSRSAGRLVSFDLTSGLPALGATLAPQSSSIPSVVVDRGGSTVYALLASGHPYAHRLDETQQPGTNWLVRLDAATLTENGRIEIGLAHPSADLRLSPDERWLSIVTRASGQVVLVDLEKFEVGKRFLSAQSRAAAWTPDGATLAIVTPSAVRTHATGVGFPMTGQVEIPSLSRVMRAGFVADGRLWVGRRDEFQIVDVATGVVLPVSYGAVTLEVFDGEAFIAGTGDSQVYRMNNSGVEVTQYNFNDSNYGHTVTRSPF